MALVGEDRKAVRAVFNRFMKTDTLNWRGKVDQNLGVVIDPDKKEEQIRITVEITNPVTDDAMDLIHQFGGVMPNTNNQIKFSLVGTQSRAKKGQEDDGTGDMFPDGDQD